MTGLMNTPIGMLFQTMGGDNSGGINDYYEITTDDMNNTDDVIISDNVEDDEAIVVDGVPENLLIPILFLSIWRVCVLYTGSPSHK